jgi:hypothetical protein
VRNECHKGSVLVPGTSRRSAHRSTAGLPQVLAAIPEQDDVTMECCRDPVLEVVPGLATLLVALTVTASEHAATNHLDNAQRYFVT